MFLLCLCVFVVTGFFVSAETQQSFHHRRFMDADWMMSPFFYVHRSCTETCTSVGMTEHHHSTCLMHGSCTPGEHMTPPTPRVRRTPAEWRRVRRCAKPRPPLVKGPSSTFVLLLWRLKRSSSLCCLDTKLTAAYSSSAEKTKRRHTAIQMSMAFT